MNSMRRRFGATVVFSSGLGGCALADHREMLVNWSGTHTAFPSRIIEPESISELENIVAESQASCSPMRVLGSSLSPNA